MQNYRKSLPSFRAIYINGEIPFEEMKNYRIPYAANWQGVVLQDGNESPYSFYLTKGKNTIRFEATHEPFIPIIVQLEELSRSEEHTSELQSRGHLVCRLL